MNLFDSLIDPTTFGTVRRYLKSASSPITTVMFVQHRDTLPRVAAALTGEDGHSPPRRRQQWAAWLAAGEVRTGGFGAGCEADLDAIRAEAACEVLYLPPVYLVWLDGCPLPRGRRVRA